jgi:hypothetical protein
MSEKKPAWASRGKDPAWELTRTLGISLAEANVRIAAEKAAAEDEAKAKAKPADPVNQGEGE